jgi:hypothetical protein
MKSAIHCDAMLCRLLKVYGSIDESTASNFRVKNKLSKQTRNKQLAAEAGDNTFLRNVDTRLPIYRTLHPKRQYSS